MNPNTDYGIPYFQHMADNASDPRAKQYWLNRKSGAEKFKRQHEAQMETQRKMQEAEAERNRLENLSAPVVTLESRHPHGVIVRWEKPVDWEPDDYQVWVRDQVPTGATRSVAPIQITADTREVTLTKSYLKWGEYKEPYWISVAAQRSGYGFKESEPQVYPPGAVAPDTPVVEDNRQAEMAAAVAQQKADEMAAIKARHAAEDAQRKQPVVAPPVEHHHHEHEYDPQPTRMDRIVAAVRTYTGKRTRSGKPYVRQLRKHAGIPDITVAERNQAWKMARK